MKRVIINKKIEGIFYDTIEHDEPYNEYIYKSMLRHSEFDWLKPISIEKFVFVNKFGTLYTKEPLLNKKQMFINIRKYEEIDESNNNISERKTIFSQNYK